MVKTIPDAKSITLSQNPLKEAIVEQTKDSTLKDAVSTAVTEISNSKSPTKNPADNNLLETKVQPIPLSEELPPVPNLDENMVPVAIRNYAFDEARRIQCPVVFIVVQIIAALGSMIAYNYKVQIKANDDFAIFPNIWCMIIGDPSVKKSPALQSAMRAIYWLEAKARELAKSVQHDLEMYEKAGVDPYADKKAMAKSLLEEGKKEDAFKLLNEIEKATNTEPERYTIADATVQALGVALKKNPHGLIMIRDELGALINHLERTENADIRAQFMEMFAGNNPLIVDRIGRENIHLLRVILSITGSIQPSVLNRFVNQAVNGHINDGFMQRFQLAVWPDPVKDIGWIDMKPSLGALEAYQALFNRFAELRSDDDTPKVLRFSDDAMDVVKNYWNTFSADIQDEDLHPVVRSHLAKSPKLFGTIAAVFHLAENDDLVISKANAELALRWYLFLKPHVIRIYSGSTNAPIAAAKNLLRKREKLEETFSIRDIRRKGWIGLKESKSIEQALEVLVDHNYLREVLPSISPARGRPTVRYRWIN